MTDYKPTVYEQIVIDFLDGKDLHYETYSPELIQRGWNERRYFDSYIEDIKYIKSLMDCPDFNLRKAADLVKNNHPSPKENVLRFSLTDAEKQIVLDAEEKGMFKAGEIIQYDGYDKKIKCADYKRLPDETDALVIFSGHPGSAEPAIEAWFNDYKHTNKPKKLIFLGLYDNQGNTDFSQSDLRFNTGSEVEMYVRYCREIGISEQILQECLVTPNDTSTEDNTKLLAEIRNKFFDRNKTATFVMFGYPAYSKRVASEFAFQFNEMAKKGEVFDTAFIIPVVPVSKDEKKRYLSYDNLDGIAQDIIIGNCLAHPYRAYAGGRFDSKLGSYPEEFKPLLPISLVYSYPNVANELAGTDTKVATILKLLRAVQHNVYKFEDAKKVDRTIQYNAIELRKHLVYDGIIDADTAFYGNHMSAQQMLQNVIASINRPYSDNKHIDDSLHVLLGKNTAPRKITHPDAQKYMESYLKRRKEKQ